MKVAKLPEVVQVPRRGTGKTPAVILVDPRYSHNAAGALRACAALGARQLWITGQRTIEEWQARGRLSREERMKAYGDVEVFFSDYPLEAFGPDVTPVCVEVLETAEPLATFEHPENVVYVFGPEDGSVPKTFRRLAHRFLILPADHCLNLAAAVTWVLGDRRVKRQLAGIEPILPSACTLDEQRGWLDTDETLALQ